MKPDLSRRSAFGAKADQQLDRALKQQLRAMSTPAGDHIDAETLAAWADGGLDANAMASVESHVSSCPRCQSIAGVMARSAPVVEAAPSRAFRIPAWWFPIAAGAAAVTIWMVVPQQRDSATAPPSPTAIIIPATPEQRPAEAPRDSFGQSQGKDQAAPPAREDRRERGAFAESKPQEPSAKLNDAAAKEDTDASKRLQQKNELAAAAPAVAPPSSPSPAAPVPSAAAIGELQKSARLASAPLEIASPNASQRWRVTTTDIERSNDGGRTWLTVQPTAGAVITGGAAPGGSVCWLIGRAGIVLVSADGASFARVPLPDAIDLASIAATDARNATVTTVDGRRFRTDDAGRTWRQN